MAQNGCTIGATGTNASRLGVQSVTEPSIMCLNSSMYRQHHDELPPELILSIQRILEIQPGPDSDPLDTLSDDLSTTDILNSYFPDGQHPTSFITLRIKTD